MSIYLEKTTQYVHSDKICLAVYHWGTLNPERQTIVFIHGYPDSAEVWEAIAHQLATDFNVVAYDVRGTGQSDIPEHSSQYRFDDLVQDLSRVIAAVSPDRPVHLVGHDWGALQGWEAVLGDRLKAQISSYSALAPSIDHVGWWFHRQWAQGNIQGYTNVVKRLAGSSYMGLLQIPVLPELTWRLGLDKIWANIVGQLEHTTVAHNSSQRRNAISGLGLYRNNLTKGLIQPTTRKTTIPVQMLLMTKDPFVPLSLCYGMEEWAEQVVYNEVDGGHWGIISRPVEIANQIRDYLNRPRDQVIGHS